MPKLLDIPVARHNCFSCDLQCADTALQTKRRAASSYFGAGLQACQIERRLKRIIARLRTVCHVRSITSTSNLRLRMTERILTLMGLTTLFSDSPISSEIYTYSDAIWCLPLNSSKGVGGVCSCQCDHINKRSLASLRLMAVKV